MDKVKLLSALVSLIPMTMMAANQDDYYTKEQIPLPKGVTLEVGCLSLFGDDQLVVGTRRGEIWVLSNIHAEDVSDVEWQQVFTGAHEPLGIFEKDGWFHFMDRDAYARIGDRDGDGTYEAYEVISNQWGITGDYHEYNFGSRPDAEGNVYVAHCLTGSFQAGSQWRGWVQQIAPDGTTTPFASGVRSPGGIGFNGEGDLFYTDNQGIWNGTSCLKHAPKGKFTGCPKGNIFYRNAPAHMGARPKEPVDGSRIVTEAKRIPEYVPPAVQIPHGKVGQSPTAIYTPDEPAKLGLPEGQLLIGEHTHSGVQRVYLEKVNGVYQGVVWKLLEKMKTGTLAIHVAENGTMFTGGSVRGWPSNGQFPLAIERTKWTGVAPLEMEKVNATPNGFKITFTEAVDPASVAAENFCKLSAWTYQYRAAYGSPEVDAVTPVVTKSTLSQDGTELTLELDQLTQGHVHHIQLNGIKTKAGKDLWHKDAYYTLNQIPN